jgi:hypothetical protein
MGSARSIGWRLARPAMSAAFVCMAIGMTAPRASGEGAVRIEEVTPGRLDSLLVCSLGTHGLPDAPSRETIESGLPSALVLAFTLLDRSGRQVGGSRAEVRIEPDLWEQIFLLRTPLRDHRAGTIEEVERLLSALGPLPVLSRSAMPSISDLRIRVRMAIHPLAPAEIERVHDLLAGESIDGNTGRREVSVGFGSLLRYFLGGEPEEDWIATATSQPFSWESLTEAP